jgi:carboxyl-terminal processing protease
MKKSRLLVVGVVAAALGALPVAFAVGASTASSGLSTQDLALIGGVIQLVQRDYVHPVSAGELTDDALKGMLTRLDPHSDYMNQQEFEETQSDISGKFGGLGIQISEQNGVPKVISPIDGTPAAKAGIQPGDLIVSIDGKSTQGQSLNKIVSVLRGDPDTKVTISILRGNKAPFDVPITRQIISVDTVKSNLEANNIGYVRVTEFGEGTPTDFKKAVNNLKQKAGGHLNGLVLDLRNDPGGLLTSAVSLAGDFLDSGKVVTIRGRRSDDQQAFNVPDGGMLLPLQTPIVVLINGASASASEIVAGALQDRHRATIMGTQSFGKGSVQTVIPLKGHGALRLTTALYYTPNGRSIQGEGITPDEMVEAPKDQQVTGGLELSENSLQGAFANPGSLNTPAPAAGASAPTTGKKKSDGKPVYSAPIKIDLIGTPNDAQLKAAMVFLDKGHKTTTGEGQASQTQAPKP